MTVNFAKRSLIFACLIGTLSGFLKSEEPTEISLEMSRSILQAEELLSASLFEDATQVYKEILADLETQPENEKIKSEVHYRLAQVLFQSNDYTTAINYLTEVKNNPNRSLLLGKAYRRNGLYKEAIDNLQTYLNQKDKNHADEAFFELGLSFLATENLDKSLESLSQASEITENSDLRHRAFVQIAYIYAKNHLYSKAFDSLKKAEDDLSENSSLKKEIYYVKGKLFYNQKKWQEALSEFEQASSSGNTLQEEWSQEHLYLLGKTFLQLAEASKISTEQKNYFQSSTEVLKKLIKLKENDDHWLALSETLVSQNMRLEDGVASQEALFILNDQTKLGNSPQVDRIKLLTALAQPSYEERHNQLRLLSNKDPQSLEVWYARGLNDFEAGFSLKNKDQIDESIKLFGRAGVNFKRATQIALQESSEKALPALLMEAKSYDYSNQKQLALNILDSFWDQPNINIQDPLEIVILYSQIAQSKPLLAIDKLIAVENLKENAQHPIAIYRLATFYYLKGDYDLSYKFFAKLLEENPPKELTPQILLSLIYSGTKLGIDKDLIKNYRKKILQEYPQSQEAAEAYFTTYSYQDYLQGDKYALKHLNQFPLLYPRSPLLINSYLLMGLDLKRDRRSIDGKWLTRRNPIAAIDNFLLVENTFNQLFKEQLIPANKTEHYLLVSYRAQLERGIANFNLSNESKGAKKQVYLEFAEETFSQLLDKLQLKNSPFKKWITNPDPYSHLSEEAVNWLAQTHIANNQFDKAEATLKVQLEKYKESKVTKGFFLSKTWTLLAYLASERNDNQKALDYLLKAEDAAKGKILTVDQKLDLWIKQSLCCKELKDYEKALLILSKAVNDDAVSGLRIKAMYLRAEIYEAQERFELARKQLESTAKKGGEWALQAKQKLEKNYGYK